jgi:hypothetical protein
VNERFLIKYGVWIFTLTPPILWELLAFFVRRGTITHPTISQMIKSTEPHRPLIRLLWGVVMVLLFTHLVYPTF